MQNPIILFGTGRSGTTILMDALFCHKDIAFFPNYLEKKPSWLGLNRLRNFHDNKQFRILKKRDNSLTHKLINPFISKPVEGYSIWKHILPEHINFSRDYLNEYTISESEKQKVHQYLQSLTSLQNRSRLALKITGPGRLKFLSELFPDAKFVWLKRDFVPTLSSFLHVDFYKERKTQELWWNSLNLEHKLEHLPEIKDDPVLFTAFQLHEINKDIQTSISQQKLNVLSINYEDFTKRPEQTLSKVMNYCKLPTDYDCLKFLKETNIEGRNKDNSDYFDQHTLNKIQDLQTKLNHLDEY